LGKPLELAYPEERWEFKNFSRKGKKSSQRWLLLQLQKILPEGTEIIEDYQHPLLSWMGNPKAGNMQLDLWISSLNLGIEYQGEQHYHDIPGFGPSGTLAIYGIRDSLKKQLAIDNNIKYLTIPYWWDGTAASLEATLNLHFPDIFPKKDGVPIPTTIPRTSVTKKRKEKGNTS